MNLWLQLMVLIILLGASSNAKEIYSGEEYVWSTDYNENYNYKWDISAGSYQESDENTLSWTAPNVDSPTDLAISVLVTDKTCGCQSNFETVVTVLPKDPLINDTSINDTQVNIITIDDSFINDTTINDTTINDTTINDTTIDDTTNDTTNDTTINDTAIDDSTIDDSTINDTTINDTTIDDTPVEDIPVNYTSEDDTPINTTPVNDISVNDTPKDDTSIDDFSSDGSSLDDLAMTDNASSGEMPLESTIPPENSEAKVEAEPLAEKEPNDEIWSIPLDFGEGITVEVIAVENSPNTFAASVEAVEGIEVSLGEDVIQSPAKQESNSTPLPEADNNRTALEILNKTENIEFSSAQYATELAENQPLDQPGIDQKNNDLASPEMAPNAYEEAGDQKDLDPVSLERLAGEATPSNITMGTPVGPEIPSA